MKAKNDKQKNKEDVVKEAEAEVAQPSAEAEVAQANEEEALDRERHYPIIANNYYTIGTPAEPIDLSTGETEVHIDIDPTWSDKHEWDEIEVVE